MHQGGHLRIQGSHDLSEHLHDGHPHAAGRQVLSHFQPDEPAAHDHSVLPAAPVDHRLDGVRIGDGAQAEDARQVRAGKARNNRHGAG